MSGGGVGARCTYIAQWRVKVVAYRIAAMANARFQLFRNASQALTLQVSGDLDEAVALHGERETRTDLTCVVQPSLRVLWDLSALSSYSLESRVVVVRLQQFLSEKALRTAYVATTPAARSLALWAARMGDQSAACIAADAAGAAAWLRDQDESAVRIVLARGMRPLRDVAGDWAANGDWPRSAAGS